MKQIKLQEKKRRSKQIKRKCKFELLNHVPYTDRFFLDLFLFLIVIEFFTRKWLRDIEIVTNISDSILPISLISISISISISILLISTLSISILSILLINRQFSL